MAGDGQCSIPHRYIMFYIQHPTVNQPVLFYGVHPAPEAVNNACPPVD